MIHIYTDGGSRGNPGPAAVGIYMEDHEKKQLMGLGKPIGNTTNNVAEYTAVVEALTWLTKQHEILKAHKGISFFMDSQLIYSQIVGLYKIKNATLRDLLFTVHLLEADIKLPITYKHIRREFNKKADAYVNQALDRNATVSYNSTS